ncbi:tripartite tricarboxylate transporter TctA [Agaricicola taiwanensis]|uniref:Tripartite tricarboxylate transporter TctA n=1 Tax=Agaricicola taiwanensis TaxID=591372 RepID=A0A8J2YFQ3_9RHOB|nr:tripartite tricarboxylate transporter permease [Agaricicola taiwanensis]GGE30885.1 tripartite tricarboxylate transporter TctA [Agaricicola taiwanensis]
MESFANIQAGFALALQPMYLLMALGGAALGTAIGVLPGIGPSLAISLLLPFTFQLVDPVGAFIAFGGIFYGAMYGGSTTTILINTPGESSSVVTALDGYKMAQNGRAGAALSTAAIGSFFAGTVATFALMILAEPFVSFALSFGPAEYFALMVLSLCTVTAIGGGHPSKAAFSTLLGLSMGMIGLDSTSGQLRFTFGEASLFDGIDVVVAAIGLFAVSEVLFGLGNLRRQPESRLVSPGPLRMTKEEWKRSIAPWFRGSGLGFIIGVLPGAGATIASFMAYALEKKVSRHPEQFGKGAIEGVAGPEAANNASAGGALVPLLTLGIPGSATGAVMLAAFQGYGINTGPLLLKNHPDLVWGLIASLYIGNLMLLVLNLPLVGLWVKLLKIPEALLYPMILTLSTLGVYSLNRSIFDLYMLFGIGIIGFLLRRFRYPLAPVILGLALGPLLETEFRRALIGSRGDWSVFVGSPIAASALLLTLAFILVPILIKAVRSVSGVKPQMP